MIIVFTGNGKGKTTSALGQMIRVIGRGKNALMLQFIKGPFKSGEDYFNEFFSETPQENIGKFKIKKGGLGFVGILGDNLPKEEHQKAAYKTFLEFKKERDSNFWDLIILDEINVACNLGLIDKNEVVKEIKNFPENKILILTGREAPEEFIELADLVTEMKEIKHPFNQNKQAQIGVEL